MIVLPICRQTLPAVAAEKLSDLHGLADSYDIIGIDEGQFVSILFTCPSLLKFYKLLFHKFYS